LESCSRRVRRTLSSAYSVATKKAFSATKPVIREAFNKANMEHLVANYCRRGPAKFQIAGSFKEQPAGHCQRRSAALFRRSALSVQTVIRTIVIQVMGGALRRDGLVRVLDGWPVRKLRSRNVLSGHAHADKAPVHFIVFPYSAPHLEEF